MFDDLGPASLGSADDAAVVDAIGGWASSEAGAAARRLTAIGELVFRRCGVSESDPDLVETRSRWACDLWDATAAEVAAALGISARRASSQMYLAQSLRERLPRVNALFLAGQISARLVATISWRTHCVIGQAAMAAIDADIAQSAEKWGPLSDRKVDTLIDLAVEAHDPQARHWFDEAARGMDVQFGKPDDSTGTRSVWGRLFSTHAELIERRLTAIARTVCESDPRSIGQRRAEAMGAVFAGSDRIGCCCGEADCPNRAGSPMMDAGSPLKNAGSPLKNTVFIHVVADQCAVDEARDEAAGHRPSAATEQARPNTRPSTRRALLTHGGVIPTPLLAKLIQEGARVVSLETPCPQSESGYRPSAALQRFIRSRDLTCRFPGCDAPAEHCDIDHAIPYPLGPTHPSNLRVLCRKHHLLRTFWTEWTDVQSPDGTIVWTAPTGQTYTTHPGSRIFLPHWNTNTGELPPVMSTAENSPPVDRGLRMPKRRRTRAAARSQRIKNRRARNDSS